MKLEIDPEFEALIPALTEEETARLEENLVREGCRDAIVVWNGVIIDGHNRYRICIDKGIAFNVDAKEFGSRKEAKEWIIRNQLGRRNLSPFAKAELALELVESAGDAAVKRLTKEELAENERKHQEEMAAFSKEQGGDAYITWLKVKAIQRTAAPKPKRKNPDMIYLFVDESAQRVKIGVSADANSRMRELECGCPGIRLEAAYWGSTRVEKDIHKDLEIYRINESEWFHWPNCKEDFLRAVDLYQLIQIEEPKPLDTLAIAAEASGLGRSTVARAKKIVKTADEQTKADLRSGKTTINAVHERMVDEQFEGDPVVARAKKAIPELVRKLRFNLGNLGLGGRFDKQFDQMLEDAR